MAGTPAFVFLSCWRLVNRRSPYGVSSAKSRISGGRDRSARPPRIIKVAEIVALKPHRPLRRIGHRPGDAVIEQGVAGAGIPVDLLAQIILRRMIGLAQIGIPMRLPAIG